MVYRGQEIAVGFWAETRERQVRWPRCWFWGRLLLLVHMHVHAKVQVRLEELVVVSMMITNVHMHATGLALAGNKHSLSWWQRRGSAVRGKEFVYIISDEGLCSSDQRSLLYCITAKFFPAQRFSMRTVRCV